MEGCWPTLMLPAVSPVTYSEPTERSADLQSAVSQNCILRTAGWADAPAHVQGSADYKSALHHRICVTAH
jgi:hypothetical protein